MARTRLVIHIGMHKTGSSSIQRFLSRNRLALRLFGVFYPESRGADGRRESKHNALFKAISHEADHGAPHPRLGASAALVRSVGDRIERAGPRVAILSAEGFSGEKPAFAEALAPLGRRFDTKIIVFLRRQDEWLESFYRQMILSEDVREARPLDAFLACPATRAHLDYAAMLAWWAGSFGPDAVRALRYRSDPEWSLLSAFLAEAGLSPRLAALPHGRARANQAAPADRLSARWRENGAVSELRVSMTADEKRDMATRLLGTFESVHTRNREAFRAPPFILSMLREILDENPNV